MYKKSLPLLTIVSTVLTFHILIILGGYVYLRNFVFYLLLPLKQYDGKFKDHTTAYF